MKWNIIDGTEVPAPERGGGSFAVSGAWERDEKKAGIQHAI
jgi:hypothetical protein